MAKISTLEELFLDEIQDLYDAEKQLTKALRRWRKQLLQMNSGRHSRSTSIRRADTWERLEQVFESLGEKAKGKKCEAMAGLVKEGGEIASNTEETAVRDAGLIAGAQKWSITKSPAMAARALTQSYLAMTGSPLSSKRRLARKRMPTRN